MSALAKHTPLRFQDAVNPAIEIADAVQAYIGGLNAVGAPEHGTSGKRGLLYPFDGAKFTVPLGHLVHTDERDGLGDADAATGAPVGTVTLGARIQYNVAVTGVTGDVDVTKPVYFNSTDNDLTLTPPTRPIKIGFVLKHVSSTSCHVYFYSIDGIMALAAAGQGFDLINLGTYSCAAIVDGNGRTSITSPYRAEIKDVFTMIDVAPAGSGGTTLINLEIDGTDLTGGVVTVATGDTRATKKSGTAITSSTAQLSKGSLIDVEFASTTTMTGGSFDLFALVEKRPGC